MRINFRLSNLLYIDYDFPIYLFLQIFFKILNFYAFLTDDQTGSGGVYHQSDFIGSPFNLYPRNPGLSESFL